MPGYARQTSTDTSGILATTTVRNVGDSEQLLYTATKKKDVGGNIRFNPQPAKIVYGFKIGAKTFKDAFVIT